jgi:hypothetical protein
VHAPSRWRFYPRHEESRPEHVVSYVNCGFCHEPVLPHGSLALFDTHLEVDFEGSFVLIRDSEQPDFEGYSIKFLRRATDGGPELVSNVGRKPLTTQTIIGTLVSAYVPQKDQPAGPADSLDSQLRMRVDQAMAQESGRRARAVQDAVGRWGQPERPSHSSGS